jgi:phage/plasmid primase-like uncharacterized protein
MSSHAGGWSVRSAVFQLLGNKTVLANATGTSVFGGAPILVTNDRGYPLYNTYTREDGTWIFWDVSAVDGTYYAYTVGLGEDWKIVVTNPTATVTQVHYAARASSQAFMA